MDSDFVHLHTHTQASLLDGMATIDEYLNEAKRLNQKALAVTDHGNLFSIYEFINKSNDMGITPIPGIEAYLAPENPEGGFVQHPVFYDNTKTLRKYDVSSHGAYLHQTIWATSEEGLHNLSKISTISNEPERFYQKPRIDFDVLQKHSNGLAVATGCPSSEVSTRFLLGQDDKAYEFANRLVEVFGKDRVFVEIMNHNMKSDLERILIPKQVKLAKDMGLKLIATNDAHYAFQKDALHHEELLCTQSGSLMSDKTINEGGKRFAFDGDQYYLKSESEMLDIFPEEDFPGAVRNTRILAEMAQDVKIKYNPHLKPEPIIPKEYKTELSYYVHLLQKGFKERYGNAPKEIQDEAKRRVKKEFDVIYSSDFIGYMLTVREYLTWTRDNYSTKDDNDNILASSIGPGRGCFEPGSKVTTDKGYKNIEDIVNGDLVLTHDSNYHKVEKVFSYDVENDNMIKLTLSNNSIIKLTADHQVFKKNYGFIQSQRLHKGDILLGSDNHKNFVETRVLNVEPYKYSGKVYDLQVAHVHNYTISNVTVHNSVGGSIHAYLLGISELDPIKWDLIFERFLSAGRGATYRITYDDGSTEDLIVSEQKEVVKNNNTVKKEYIHQLKVGDIVEDGKKE